MKQKRYGVTTKTLVAMLALVLLIGCGIGGTLAYLTSTTKEVVNTFTVGNINIELWEHKIDANGDFTNEKTSTTTNDGNSYKIIPGVDLKKDPTVVVKGGSEDCWLFVKVDDSAWPNNSKISFNVITGQNGWTKLEKDEENNLIDDIYYREVSANAIDQEFKVLVDDKVTVSSALTKAEIDAIGNGFSLTFKAAAVQKTGVATVQAAYEQIKNDL